MRPQVREQLQTLPVEAVEAACASRWDGLRYLISSRFAPSVWMRVLHNIPNDWEEEFALQAIGTCLRSPRRCVAAGIIANTHRPSSPIPPLSPGPPDLCLEYLLSSAITSHQPGTPCC